MSSNKKHLCSMTMLFAIFALFSSNVAFGAICWEVGSMGMCEPTTAPSAPTFITYPSVSDTGLYDVKWSGITVPTNLSAWGATGELVYQESFNGNWGAEVITTSTQLNYLSPPAKAYGTYQYRVKACYRYPLSDNHVRTGTFDVKCSAYLTGPVLTVSPPPPTASLPAPVITQTPSKAFSWVLIHGDVPFLIPAFATANDGAVALTWGAVAGATHYQVRIWNESTNSWGDWISTGNQLYYNLYNENYANVRVQIWACNATGCGSVAEQTVQTSPWRNIGTCNPLTGEQQQLCIDGTRCVLNKIQYVQGCSQNITCTVQ